MLRSWFYRWLNNRKGMASELPVDAVCKVPGCQNRATEQWLPSFCALREAGVKIDWVPVCAEHDVAINENAVRELFGVKYDKELRAYRDSRLTQTH